MSFFKFLDRYHARSLRFLVNLSSFKMIHCNNVNLQATHKLHMNVNSSKFQQKEHFNLHLKHLNYNSSENKTEIISDALNNKSVEAGESLNSLYQFSYQPRFIHNKQLLIKKTLSNSRQRLKKTSVERVKKKDYYSLYLYFKNDRTF